jgi:hypothetical protein
MRTDYEYEYEYDESMTFRDIGNLMFIILFGILLLPAIIILLVFYCGTRLFGNDDRKKEDREYVTPCGYRFKESDLNKLQKKTKRKRNAKSNKRK